MKTLLLIFFSLFSLPILAQEVSNVQVRQTNEKLSVSFDLFGKADDYLVTIEYAEDGQQFLQLKQEMLRPGKKEILVDQALYCASCIFRVHAVDVRIMDIDGNYYHTVKIGDQVWMRENLKTSKYRNGDPIPTHLSDADWGSTSLGAYAIYNNDSANNTTYGKLYNWYAVADPRGLCPAGWHVPSDAEWTTLENFLGGASVAGGKMKSTGTIEAGTGLWQNPNTDATNSSGFAGLPGGYRGSIGTYNNVGGFGYWWSSTEGSSPSAGSRSLGYTNGGSVRTSNVETGGFSVRCLRD